MSGHAGTGIGVHETLGRGREDRPVGGGEADHPVRVGVVFDRRLGEDLRARLAQHGPNEPYRFDSGAVVEEVDVDPGQREQVDPVDVDAGGVERGDRQRRPPQAGPRAQIASDPQVSLGMGPIPEDRRAAEVSVAHEVGHGLGPHAVDLVRRSGWLGTGHQLDPRRRVTGLPILSEQVN